MKYCQGPKCHTYYTQDRIRGPKGNKTNQTRRRSHFYYLGGNACSTRCEQDWFNKFGDMALDHFGRITQPIILGAENAWFKDYDYHWQTSEMSNWRFVNKVTKEERPLTEEQYNDRNYDLNERTQ
jgi:hypothetical protein